MLENSSAVAISMSQPGGFRLPEMKRDSTWLAGADLFAVFLALFGQVILTRSLLSSDYGLFVILLDLFATTFLIIDLGLPTLLARSINVCLKEYGTNCRLS